MTSEADLRLTDTQQKILAALCSPCTGENHYAPPATNQEIADQLFLSVDAIKAHLRVLYRKFGIDPLPHNQKRARLVELAVEGGLVTPAGTDPAPAPDTEVGIFELAGASHEPPSEAPAPSSPPRPPRRRPSKRIAALAVAGLALLAVLAWVVSSSGGENAEPPPTKASYISTVQRFCRFALREGDGGGEATRSQRAVGYLSSIGLVQGPINSGTAPAGDDPGLEQFRAGVNSAADLNGKVASAPGGAAATTLEKLSAGLIIAAGNVQAGALKYKLGAPCASLGQLIGKSAENAAGPP